MQSRTNSTLELYKDGFRVGNVSARLSNAVLNIRDISRGVLSVAAGAFSFFGSAQAFSCKNFGQIQVSKDSYLKDSLGADYKITRMGCDKVAAEDQFDINQLSQCGNINIPTGAEAANYLKMASYYHDKIQLAMGAGQQGNSNALACVQEYLAKLEAALMGIDKENQARRETVGKVMLIASGAFILALAIFVVTTLLSDSPKQERARHIAWRKSLANMEAGTETKTDDRKSNPAALFQPSEDASEDASEDSEKASGKTNGKVKMQ